MTVKYVRANDTVVVRHPEGSGFVSVHNGDIRRSDDPVVKAYEWLFTSDSDLPVESAVSEPGSKRGYRR